MANKINQSTYDTIIEALQSALTIWEQKLNNHQNSRHIQEWVEKEDELSEKMMRREKKYKAQIEKFQLALRDFQQN